MRSGRQILPHVITLVGWTISVTAQAESKWTPATTFVLAASVTEWPTKAGLTPLNIEKRRDQDLVNQFRKSGVPSANIIFLKESEATHAGICKALTSLAGRAGMKSTL